MSLFINKEIIKFNNNNNNNKEIIKLNDNIEKILSEPIEIGVSYLETKSEGLVVLNNEVIFINEEDKNIKIKLKIRSIGEGLKQVDMESYTSYLEIEVGKDVAVYLNPATSYDYKIKVEEGGILYLFDGIGFKNISYLKKEEWRWYTRKKGKLKEYSEEEWMIKEIVE